MERRQLEYFIAVVDHGGFGRAAEAVHVTQPSLSQAVSALEKDVGAPLFHRVGRKVRLTSAGESLLEPARQVLRDFAVARATVAKVRGVYDGTLDIASTPTIAAYPLCDLLSQFCADHPGIQVRLTDCDVPGGIQAVVGGGQSEIGVFHLPVHSPALQSVTLGTQRFFLVLPPGSTTPPSDDPVDLSVLGEVPLIATPKGSTSRQRLDDALALGGVSSPRIVLETIYRASIVDLVVAGIGAALLPGHLAARAASHGARSLPTRPSVSHEIGIVRRPGPLSPAAQAFVDMALRGAPFGD